jgi:hypothetical protein
MDSFTYGKAARQGPSLGRKPVYVALGAVLVVALGWAVFTVTKTGGEAVVKHVEDTTKQIDTAGDVEAQTNLNLALTTAKTAFVEAGSYGSAGYGQLSALDPALTYIDGSGASTGPKVVSVEATEQAWGAAVLSSSGTCFFIRDVAGGSTAYGSGEPCTGEAAMGATGAHF